MTANGNGNGNGNGHGHVDKAIRALALGYVQVDLQRLREFVEERAKDDPEWAMTENLVESLGRNMSILLDLSGESIRGDMPLAKRAEVPEAWLEQVTRRLKAAEKNRSLIHATRGFRLACDPSKIYWGNTFGKHALACESCRAAHEAGRIREGGQIPQEEVVEAKGDAEAAKPEGRPARVLRGGKGARARKAATRGGKRKVAV